MKNDKERKNTPVYSGFIKYFPKAIAEVSRVSLQGQKQHKNGELVWDRNKSPNELDSLARHLLNAGKKDVDGERHSAKLAWRALANLEKEIESHE